MENPWTEFQNNPKQDYLILEADKLVVDKFNETANEKFRIHTEIMPAPFMGNQCLELPQGASDFGTAALNKDYSKELKAIEQ